LVVEMTRIVTAGELLDGHTVLDIECLDRIYLNAYVPILQSSGQVVAFMTQHLGKPIPSPALMEHIGTRFRKAVESYASANGIPWVKFGKDDRKIDVMQPYLAAQAETGKSGVAAIGISQEFQRVWAAYQRDTRTAAPQYTFAKADRRVTCYYFYLWDEDFGPAFIKVCAYFPYPAKIWVNGHERAKRQALRAGIAFTELSSGFASCDDPVGLQEICDRLQPGTIEVFAQRWLHRLPMPFGPADQQAGYWWQTSMRQVEATVLASPAFERIAHPSADADGRRTPALRFGDPRVTALAGALAATLTTATGITNKSLRALMAGLLHAQYTPGQMTYDLRRLRLAGLIRRIERTSTYVLTPDGIKFAVFYTKLHNRLLRPLMAAGQAQAPPNSGRPCAP
jgi:hypothetical protein